jgi:hypothetical protein
MGPPPNCVLKVVGEGARATLENYCAVIIPNHPCL